MKMDIVDFVNHESFTTSMLERGNSMKLFHILTPTLIICGMISAATVTPAKFGYAPNATITINFSGGPGYANDWIGIYNHGAPNGPGYPSLDWKTVNNTRTPTVTGITSGSITLAGRATPGTYDHPLDGYDLLATATITVQGAPSVTPSKSTYATNETITINFAGGPGNANDWIGIFNQGAPASPSLDWKTVNNTRTPTVTGITSGSITLAGRSTPGTYEIRFHPLDGYDLLATAFIQVVSSVPSYSGYTLWSNETFDNGWDGSKWTTGCGTFGENACRFDPAAVYTSGGNLHLKIWKETGNYGAGGCENASSVRDYKGGEFRMINAAVAYGIAEARINTPGNGGYVGSLFTYDYGAGTNRTDGWNEIDVELEGRTQDKISTNLLEGNCSHSWECTQWCYCACSQLINPWSGFSHAGQWHDYRMEFTPNYIKWFVDGNCIRTIDGSYVYRNPNGEDVRYASATNGCLNGWRDGYIPGHSTRVMTNMWLAQHGSVATALGGEWSDSQLPKETLYDWIRVYTRN
jgi:beta-glucanase (GH16 family)